MSGIAGLLRLDATPVAPHKLDAMLAPMLRRGPDRQAVHCEANAGFAQALLATTPEALAETQPWRHPDTGCLVVSDSRLDNRPQLLRELGIARPADEAGDGELLHAAWQRWGEACADRLRGDFAFAVWDPQKQTLYCARDPMGVRPFLYHHRPGRLFVFASCVEAVLAQGEVPRDLDEGRIADALIQETEGIDETCTFYQSVQRLPPATWLRLRLGDGDTEQRRYWRPIGKDRPIGLPQSEQEWIEAQRERLDRAVRLRLRSQCPVGSMLSGGLDSSSVVALASQACAQQGSPPFPIFSATNSADPDCLETRAIRAVTAHVRCAPTFVDLPGFVESGTEVSRAWGEGTDPFDTSMTLVASLYEAAAARGVASLLDGVPADNLFATGRQARYLFDQGRRREAWQAALDYWKACGGTFPRLSALLVMAGCLSPAPVHALREHVAEAREYRELLRTSLIRRDFAHRVGLRQRYHRYRQTIGGSHQWHESGQALSTLAAPYITAALERYNRVASQFGVEPRPPFADRDLIEFQAWMPPALRIRDGRWKWVLRQAMTGRLPTEVAWREDKQHIGWRFNRILLDRALAAGNPSHEMHGADYLDPERMDRAWRHPDSKAGHGLPAAVWTFKWRKKVDHRIP